MQDGQLGRWTRGWSLWSSLAARVLPAGGPTGGPTAAPGIAGRNAYATTTTPYVSLAPGAEENGLAIMLGDLVRQNLEAKPRKMADFDALDGRVSIVADDADVALTLVFEKARGGSGSSTTLTIHDGIVGIPDVTIRGPSDAILALSNMPLATPLGLPFPSPGDAEGMKTFLDLSRQMRQGKLHFYGMLLHVPLVMKLTRVMSVNG